MAFDQFHARAGVVPIALLRRRVEKCGPEAHGLLRICDPDLSECSGNRRAINGATAQAAVAAAGGIVFPSAPDVARLTEVENARVLRQEERKDCAARPA